MSKYPKVVNKKKLRIYVVWDNMIQRCTNPNNPNYKYYGARGITVCEEWLSYDAFYEWAMATGYDFEADRKEQSLDREDNNKGYSPDNCRWVSMKIQERNKRTNVYVNNKCLSEIAENYGVSVEAVNYRYKKGERNLDELGKPCREGVKIDGLTIKELAKREGISEALIRNRWRKGVRDIEKLIDPINKNKAQVDKVFIEGYTFMEIHKMTGIPLTVLRTRYYMYGKKSLIEIMAPYKPKHRKEKHS